MCPTQHLASGAVLDGWGARLALGPPRKWGDIASSQPGLAGLWGLAADVVEDSGSLQLTFPKGAGGSG